MHVWIRVIWQISTRSRCPISRHVNLHQVDWTSNSPNTFVSIRGLLRGIWPVFRFLLRHQWNEHNIRRVWWVDYCCERKRWYYWKLEFICFVITKIQSDVSRFSGQWKFVIISSEPKYAALIFVRKLTSLINFLSFRISGKWISRELVLTSALQIKKVAYLHWNLPNFLDRTIRSHIRECECQRKIVNIYHNCWKNENKWIYQKKISQWIRKALKISTNSPWYISALPQRIYYATFNDLKHQFSGIGHRRKIAIKIGGMTFYNW